MIKKIAVLLGLAGLAFVVKQQLDQKKDTKDLWAQAADKPAGTSSH